MGVSYFCNKGQLGENEAVGNRTDMFSQETLRAIVRTLEEKDPARAETLRHTIEGAKCGLSHMLGTHVSPLALSGLVSKTWYISTTKLPLPVPSYRHQWPEYKAPQAQFQILLSSLQSGSPVLM